MKDYAELFLNASSLTHLGEEAEGLIQAEVIRGIDDCLNVVELGGIDFRNNDDQHTLESVMNATKAPLNKIIDWVYPLSPLADYPLHGLNHWAGVFRNGLVIAYMQELLDPQIDDINADPSESLDKLIVLLLFSIFHDCARVTEGEDLLHGPHGAAHLMSHPLISEFKLAEAICAAQACIIHTSCTSPLEDMPKFVPEGFTEEEWSQAIGLCLDADRIDLARLGIIPESDYLYFPDASKKAFIHLWNKETW